MSDTSADLHAFLLARIDEDEQVASQWPDDLPPPPKGHAFWRDTNGHLIYQPRQRMLAESQAKRRIIAIHGSTAPRFTDYPGTCLSCDEDPEDYDSSSAPWPCPTVRALAAVYATHPDYRAEWAPREVK